MGSIFPCSISSESNGVLRLLNGLHLSAGLNEDLKYYVLPINRSIARVFTRLHKSGKVRSPANSAGAAPLIRLALTGLQPFAGTRLSAFDYSNWRWIGVRVLSEIKICSNLIH